MGVSITTNEHNHVAISKEEGIYLEEALYHPSERYRDIPSIRSRTSQKLKTVRMKQSGNL